MPGSRIVDLGAAVQKTLSSSMTAVAYAALTPKIATTLYVIVG